MKNKALFLKHILDLSAAHQMDWGEALYGEEEPFETGIGKRALQKQYKDKDIEKESALDLLERLKEANESSSQLIETIKKGLDEGRYDNEDETVVFE